MSATVANPARFAAPTTASDPASFGLRHVRGGKDYLGWVVERYGHAAEADTVEVTAIAELPCEAAYEISWEERPHVRD